MKPCKKPGDEWGTPLHIIAMASEVMGGIDLDPATSVHHRERIGMVLVRTGFGADHGDTFARDWHGSVWLNPPFSQPLVRLFVRKLIDEHHAGRVPQAICLLNAAPETRHWQQLFAADPLVCWPSKRIQFTHPDPAWAAKKGNRYSQGLAYLGPNRAAFRRVFGAIGVVR